MHMMTCQVLMLGQNTRGVTIVINRNPDNGAFAGASRDCAIVIRRNPNNDTHRAGAFPAKESPPQMTTKLMMLSTLQGTSSSGRASLFSAKAADTISSMLDYL